MKSKFLLTAFVLASLAFSLAQAQTNPFVNSRPIVVDKVVANPEKFKGPINVSGQVAELGGSNALFALSCEDKCFSMPIRFSGIPPKPGSNVVVHGQLAKESNGRYVFNADSVTAKK